MSLKRRNRSDARRHPNPASHLRRAPQEEAAMKTAEENAKLGCAIMPWWLNRTTADQQTWIRMGSQDAALRRRAEIAAEAGDYCPEQVVHTHHATVYMVRHHDPAQCEWLTREAYCLRALEILSRTITTTGRGLNLRYDGKWKVYVEKEAHQLAITAVDVTLEDAVTAVLAQLDPLWKR